MIANIIILTSILFSEEKNISVQTKGKLIKVGDKKSTAVKKESSEKDKKAKEEKESMKSKSTSSPSKKNLTSSKLKEETEEFLDELIKKPLLKPEVNNSDMLKTLSASSHTPSISSLMTKKFSIKELEGQLKNLEKSLLNVKEIVSGLKESQKKVMSSTLKAK